MSLFLDRNSGTLQVITKKINGGISLNFLASNMLAGNNKMLKYRILPKQDVDWEHIGGGSS